MADEPIARTLFYWLPVKGMDIPATMRAVCDLVMRLHNLRPVPQQLIGDAQAFLFRDPEENLRLANDPESELIVWHSDGHKGYTPPYILFWSNVLPIEIATTDYLVQFPIRGGDVVLCDHLRSFHQMAPETKSCTDRWSFRVWVEKEE